jgi:hypothetical protein
MPGRAGIFKLLQEYAQPSNELIWFKICRRRFEKRLSAFQEAKAEQLTSTVDWMLLIILEKAPELLNYLR